jgi:PilZ domain
MMEVLGPEAVEHLSARFAQGQPNEAVETVGLLTRIDFPNMEKLLPARLNEWPRTVHDRAIRQIVISGAPQRGKLLLSLLDCVDPLFRAAVIDEIGISGELSAEMVLLRMAEGHLPKDGSEYLQIKAIEALGRLRTPGAEAVLRKIAEARKTFRWAHVYELRLVATQAMNGINPEWVRSFIPRSELSVSDLMIEPLNADPASLTVSQRRYERFRLDPAVPAQTLNLKKNCHLEVREMSLSGGMAVPEHTLHPGSFVELRLNPSSGKPIRMHTIIRTAGPQVATFEIVDIEVEERTKLRKLLAQRAGNAPKPAAEEERHETSPHTVTPSST